MLRRIISGLGLMAVAASAAQAQVGVTFHANSGNFYDNARGVITSGAAGVTGGGFVNNTAFQIWCVDQNNTAKYNNYDAWVSRLDGSMTETRANNSNTYAKAAFLASGMTAANQNAKQYAIWAIVHGKSAANYCSGTGPSGCTVANVTAQVTLAGTGYTTINKSEWYVISNKTEDNPFLCGLYDGCTSQEFIARCQTGGPACDGFTPPNAETPTPEPATMSLLALGLAGMAGTSLRRRKK